MLLSSCFNVSVSFSLESGFLQGLAVIAKRFNWLIFDKPVVRRRITHESRRVAMQLRRQTSIEQMPTFAFDFENMSAARSVLVQ
jgi:hypothetical protein